MTAFAFNYFCLLGDIFFKYNLYVCIIPVFGQLQEVFVGYKKEKTESVKALTEQSEKLQDQVTEHRSENTKISTQLEFTSKRYPVIRFLWSSWFSQI